MSKFTLFTLFLSATITIVVAELIVNEYVKYPADRGQIMASVLEDTKALTFTQETQQQATETALKFGDISFELLSVSGFTGVTLQPVPFNGVVFESIDTRDLKNINVVQQNLLMDNRLKIGVFYEFLAGSEPFSNEIYKFILDKSKKIADTSINEANSFGDASFYLNFLKPDGNAFLVVKIKENVYALTYQKDYHPLIRKLLWELNK
jgi:hypothetical protein